jgi:diketogulonate reductase-like aldo/keto reductase
LLHSTAENVELAFECGFAHIDTAQAYRKPVRWLVHQRSVTDIAMTITRLIQATKKKSVKLSRRALCLVSRSGSR